MKNSILEIAFILLAAMSAGCTSTAGSAIEESKQVASADAQLDEVKTETKEAVESMWDYAGTQKQEFVDKTKSELLEIQNELDQLSAKVDNSRAETRADAKAKLNEVRQKLADLQEQLTKAEDAAESTWDDVKDGFEKSRDELKKTFDETRQWLSDKIEPEQAPESV